MIEGRTMRTPVAVLILAASPVFAAELPPVLDHYAAQGLVRRVEGAQSIDEVHAAVVRATMGASRRDT